MIREHHSGDLNSALHFLMFYLHTYSAYELTEFSLTLFILVSVPVTTPVGSRYLDPTGTQTLSWMNPISYQLFLSFEFFQLFHIQNVILCEKLQSCVPVSARMWWCDTGSLSSFFELHFANYDYLPCMVIIKKINNKTILKQYA